MDAESAESTNLPALIDRATNRLSEARTSAEVLEAKAIAELALHYAKLTKAANETHADCLRMIVRAEMRMATEIDKGQERGEVANAGVNQWSSEDRTTTLDSLGVSRQRLHEWRETRDAGEHVVEAAIAGALNEGRAPTKADVRRSVGRGVAQPITAVNPPSNGMQYARLAVLQLEEIRDDDAEREQAFAYVRSWIDARNT